MEEKKKKKQEEKKKKEAALKKVRGDFLRCGIGVKYVDFSTSYILSLPTQKGDFHPPSLQSLHITCPKGLNPASP